ncbi:MAG: hypothetical protein ABIB43_01830 [archaeon]|nr:hypothetical protein [Nanoarchaeota archaeon]
MVKKNNKSFGAWAFIFGTVLALLFGLLGWTGSISWLLVILGLLIGLLNIAEKETQAFLVAGTVLVIVSSFGMNAMKIIPILGNVLGAILYLFVPATIIVALKSVFTLAKE